ncbi:MAG TPA: tagaturonate epimerase family protein [Bryobacteraceae bacterium]|nr:tagaturonate epimerase family protein [Bryobacteraceae bacterium]
MPSELPLRSSEAAALADLILEHAEGKPLTGDLRSRLAGLAAALSFETLVPCFGSLERDPVHNSAYFVAVDTKEAGAQLLRVAPLAAPASAIYPVPVLIGRVPSRLGGELVLHATPFASTDHENIRNYAELVNQAFLPRPQGAQAAIAVGNRHPEISLPAVFEAFRRYQEKSGVNLASTVQLSATREMTTDDAIAARDGENPTAAGHTRVSIRHLYHTGLWAAIRAGWREGYNAEADHFIVSGNTPDEIARSVEATKEAIRHAAGYTKFTTDTSRLFVLEADTRHPAAWSDSVVAEKFEALFSPEEKKWILAEFARKFAIGEAAYTFSREDVLRLAVKFGESLKLNEALFDYIRGVKASQKASRAFDFEPSIDEADTLTTAKELIFYMHWLKARGRAAQLVPPNLGFKKRQAYPETMEALHAYAHHKMWPELEPRVASTFGGRPLEELGQRVRELAGVARHFEGTLSIHSGSGKQAEVLEEIGKATSGRLNYKISGELQLQLFDVLSEQPAGTAWRALYERMAARANRFAAAGAFGAESELAAQYPQPYLGDAARGRVDGNLFLVFWLGNMVGSRDIDSPDGDHRFFKEKLDELPPDLLAEVRRRNTNYILWLAGHLIG